MQAIDIWVIKDIKLKIKIFASIFTNKTGQKDLIS